MNWGDDEEIIDSNYLGDWLVCVDDNTNITNELKEDSIVGQTQNQAE